MVFALFVAFSYSKISRYFTGYRHKKVPRHNGNLLGTVHHRRLVTDQGVYVVGSGVY